MVNIYINDLQTRKLEELNLVADYENGIKNVSDMELNNVQGGIYPPARPECFSFTPGSLGRPLPLVCSLPLR